MKVVVRGQVKSEISSLRLLSASQKRVCLSSLVSVGVITLDQHTGDAGSNPTQGT